MLTRNNMGQYQRKRPGFIRRTAGYTLSLTMTIIKIIGFLSLLLGFLVAFMIFFPDHAVTEWVKNKMDEYEVPVPQEVKDKVLPTTTSAPEPGTTFLGFLVDVLVVLAVFAAMSFLLQNFSRFHNRVSEEQKTAFYGFEMALIVFALVSVIMTKNNTAIGKWLLLLALVLSAAAIFKTKEADESWKLYATESAQKTAFYMVLLALLIVMFRAVTGFVSNFFKTIVPTVKAYFWLFVLGIALYLFTILYKAADMPVDGENGN